jgi:hypothetical protein
MPKHKNNPEMTQEAKQFQETMETGLRFIEEGLRDENMDLIQAGSGVLFTASLETIPIDVLLGVETLIQRELIRRKKEECSSCPQKEKCHLGQMKMEPDTMNSNEAVPVEVKRTLN